VSEANDGGTAFPVPVAVDGLNGLNYGKPGMTLRDYFAGQFLATVRILGDVPADTVARNCYAVADAMLAERAK
jgi:hypothetical protein